MNKNINNFDEISKYAKENDKFATKESMFRTAINHNIKTKPTNPVIYNNITNNKFIKVMINNVEMVYGLNGIAHDVLYYIGSIISGRGIDDENRFIININADFHRKASIKLKTSTASTRRGVKELIEKGLLLKEDNDAKNDYLFNFMMMYKGTDEDYAKDCDKYNIKLRYEMAINH